MERPLSAASTGTAPSTTASGHRRQGSSTKTANRSPPSNTVSLFVRNLRLLDQDLNEDWPGITVASFSNQDARTRIKCTEYALYQLFRLYDPATTADKLQPFFPPLEPLQSVNLRAALFRCLNELKKSGVLVKDLVLRKSMLDECHGDRFWEVCLGFSTLVLRKRNLSRHRGNRSRDNRTLPIAEKLGIAPSTDKSEKECLIPLALTHKAALCKVLDAKRHKKAAYASLQEVIEAKEDELHDRKSALEAGTSSRRALKQNEAKAIEDTIATNWIGSTDLRKALIEGDVCGRGDRMLLESFDRVWNSDTSEVRHSSPDADTEFIQSLQDRVTTQSARLRRWQNFHDRLVASKPASSRPSRPASQVQRPVVVFNRHQDINLSDSSDENDEPEAPQKRSSRHASAMRYDEILTAMREELRKNSAAYRSWSVASAPRTSNHPLRRAHTQPVAPMRKLGVSIDTLAGAQNPHLRSPSGTTVPLRSPMGRRVSSRSKSYEKPKVDGQREFIPLKSEIFSPLKENRRTSISPLFGNSTLAPPVEVDEPLKKLADNKSAEDKDVHDAARVEDGVRGPTSPRDSGLGMNADAIRPALSALQSDVQSLASSSSSDADADRPLQNKQPSLARQSLAERTRKSMALNAFEHRPSSNSPERGVDQLEDDNLMPSPLPELQEPTDRRATLLERTRQSISFAPQAPVLKKPSHNRTRTSVYPVNQFETPRRARRSTVGIREEDRKVTPMEKLMSPEAEYNSVFKSRPKIAVSPVLSPRVDRDSVIASLDGSENGLDA